MKTTDIKLTEHFSLSEFTRSATAARHGIDNTPDSWQISNMRNLCREILEPLRRQFGPIHISSGFRCERLNTLVHGVGNSQHMRGEAADIHMSSTEVAKKMFAYIMANIDFDQLLLEMKGGRVHCLHISYTTERVNRRMARSSYQV